ncbi:gluconate 2-dehydrogenase subunit 3 family protein [Eudoraea chungangensis]|uniref:gluconate 2-dehydrogenase subunit 3 family protein n=1 Tax=Eudoraea chungangensis TaxID=1481905 RepID=UPI0023EDB1DC|nr:gluconate 2-dehydrogenase subunit 3 family protein [Eudoraea chungangensis]
MKRKSFLNNIGLLGGGLLLLPGSSLLQGCEYQPSERRTLKEEDIPLLDEIGETIIPTSESSPGAKAVKIGAFMYSIYKDCMPPENQAIFLSGLNDLDFRAATLYKTSFLEISADEKLELLEKLQLEAIALGESQEGADKPVPHYFDLFKSLTSYGYFTSEVGMTMARNYLPIPGKFEACINYNKGDRPWAT